MLGKALVTAIPVVSLLALGCEGAPKPASIYRGREICETAQCKKIVYDMRQAMTHEKDTKVDPCEDWDELVCGNYDKPDPLRGATYIMRFRDGQEEINMMTLMKDRIFDLLSPVVGNAWQPKLNKSPPKGADEETYNAMRRYFSTCMNTQILNQATHEPVMKIIRKIQDAYKRYESRFLEDKESSPEPMVNATLPVDLIDRDIIRNVTREMAKYRIWAFAKFEPQQSLFNSSEMRVGVVPYITKGLPWKDIWHEDWYAYKYKKIMASFLKDAYKDQWRAHDYKDLAKQVYELELNIIKIAPPLEAFRNIKENTVSLSAKDFEELAPDLMIPAVIKDQPGPVDRPPMKNLEVMFPKYWEDLQSTLGKTSKAALRAYFMWQTFLQTQELLNSKESSQYNNLMRKLDGKGDIPDRRTVCTQRTYKHFGLMLATTVMGSGFDMKREAAVVEVFENIKDQYVRMFNETPWMDAQSKKGAMDKAKKMSIMTGFQKANLNLFNWDDINKFYAGIEVTANNGSYLKWTHGDDYLRIESWYAHKAWSNDLYKPPNKDKWLVNALDMETYFSPDQNSVVVPGGIMVHPLFTSELPSLFNYAALGSMMSTEMAHAFDKVGGGLSPNGTIDDWMTREDVGQFDVREQCFADKYDKYNVTDVFPLNGKQFAGEALADTHGIDMAYAAWKANFNPHKEKILPGFFEFSDDQLFFVIRSMFHCSKTRPELPRLQAGSGLTLPRTIDTWAPLKDSKIWNEAFKCKPKEPLCRAWGKDSGDAKGLVMKKPKTNESWELDVLTPSLAKDRAWVRVMEKVAEANIDINMPTPYMKTWSYGPELRTNEDMASAEVRKMRAKQQKARDRVVEIIHKEGFAEPLGSQKPWRFIIKPNKTLAEAEANQKFDQARAKAMGGQPKADEGKIDKNTTEKKEKEKVKTKAKNKESKNKESKNKESKPEASEEKTDKNTTQNKEKMQMVKAKAQEDRPKKDKSKVEESDNGKSTTQAKEKVKVKAKEKKPVVEKVKEKQIAKGTMEKVEDVEEAEEYYVED
ncbi:hypothetical protein QQZ08_002929 [Neonectria magnoliae]|uniref:Endothelin-converting enzyme 1 n=1 Tax=Neonectria magnoliae TaxID=2732573 RepID=A0ABR1ICV6_9HYPO